MTSANFKSFSELDRKIGWVLRAPLTIHIHPSGKECVRYRGRNYFIELDGISSEIARLAHRTLGEPTKHPREILTGLELCKKLIKCYRELKLKIDNLDFSTRIRYTAQHVYRYCFFGSNEHWSHFYRGNYMLNGSYGLFEARDILNGIYENHRRRHSHPQ